MLPLVVLLALLGALASCTDRAQDLPATFPDALPAPTSLTATPVSGDQTKLDLSWDMDSGSISDVDHYNVYNVVPTTGALFLLGTSQITAYQDSGLVPNLALIYQVSAVDLTGFEGFRSEAVIGVPTGSP